MKLTLVSLTSFALASPFAAQVNGGSLDPTTIPKYVESLVVPPAMPRTAKIPRRGGKSIDYYEIAVRQFAQQVLPAGMPATTLWGYGSLQQPGTVAEGRSFHAPSFTIEAKFRTTVRVKWVNGLVDQAGNYLPHLLPVDQTSVASSCARSSRKTRKANLWRRRFRRDGTEEEALEIESVRDNAVKGCRFWPNSVPGLKPAEDR